LLDDSKSNIINIINRSNITFPNAFVVNGTNNQFKVVGRYIETMDLKIYTRWGELIAHITNPDTGWDGTQNGSKLPGGNYIYSAEMKDEAGNIHKKSGTVLLIRR
jgi:gliding motility-associated-like protein